MKMNVVAVVVSSAGDEILGAGGTIIRHILGGDLVTIAIAADRRTAKYDGNPNVVPPVPSLLPEALDAADLLGLSGIHDVCFLGFGGLTLNLNTTALNKSVTKLLHHVQPDIVYTHHWGDLNSDHRAVSEAVMVAMRPQVPMQGTAQKICCFEIPSSTEWAPEMGGFRPNYFVDITDTVDKKLEAMGAYKDEMRALPHPRNLDMMRSRAAYWGQVAGVLYAESFVLAREVV